MSRTHTNILLLQETKHGHTSTERDGQGYKTYFSSKEKEHTPITYHAKGHGKGKRRTKGARLTRKQETAGVGIIIDPATAPLVRNVNAISSRLIEATIATKPTTRIIGAYAPQAKQTEALKDTFYDQLGKLLSTKACHPTIIAGDFNARLHYRTADETPHIGPHFCGRGYDYAINLDPDTQDNRDRFTTLLQSHQLIAQNTRFKKTPKHS